MTDHEHVIRTDDMGGEYCRLCGERLTAGSREYDETPVEPYRDGKVHVMSDKCSTCVFRPGNLMNLRPGRLQSMANDVKESGIPFSCHQTLPYANEEYVEHYQGAALCAGAVEAYGDQSPVMLLANATGVIKHVDPKEA